MNDEMWGTQFRGGGARGSVGRSGRQEESIQKDENEEQGLHDGQ